jgi:hypothetical protein
MDQYQYLMWQKLIEVQKNQASEVEVEWVYDTKFRVTQVL